MYLQVHNVFQKMQEYKNYFINTFSNILLRLIDIIQITVRAVDLS